MANDVLPPAAVEVLQMRFSAALNESMALQVELVETRRQLEAVTADRDAMRALLSEQADRYSDAHSSLKDDLGE